MIDTNYTGALVELGTVQAIVQHKLTVDSLTRPGVRAYNLTALDAGEYAVGDTVYFYVLPNGAGNVTGKMGRVITADDTGWVNITPETNFTVTDSFRKRRIGNVVYLCGRVQFTGSMEVGTYYTLVSDIGEGYRPSLALNMLPLGGDYQGLVMYIDTTGQIQVRNRTGSARTGPLMGFSISYPV